jgi:hypothetical protein
MSTFTFNDPDRPTIEKDVLAVLDYTWDWTAWLAGDAISTATVTCDSSELTVASTQVVAANTKVVAFISGGGTQLGVVRRATCKIVTTGGRTEERSIYLKIVQR